MLGSSALRTGFAPVRLLVILTVVLSMMLSMVMPTYAAGGLNGNLNGTIVDSTTGAPIAGARVNLVSPSGNYKATTDAKGQFSILGAIADTYTVSIEANGYAPISQAGVTVAGDQNVHIDNIKLTPSKSLKTIGRVSARSASSAFQPGQTTDTTIVNSARIEQTTGKAASTNENQLLLAVPGATLTSSGNITIRGGLQNETGYQFDGIPFTEPFLSTNASDNRFSGLSSVQVVEGAGDATQGDVGGGVVNLIPSRGTYPATGLLDAEIGAPGQYAQGALSYGFATPNGAISNFFSYLQDDNRLNYGQPTTSSIPYGNYYSAVRAVNSDLTDNFFFKFGKDQNQSLQVLYKNQNIRSYGGSYYYGANNPTTSFQTDPYAYAPLNLASNLPNAGYLASILPVLPGQTSVNAVPSAQQEQEYDYTNVLKFGYTNQIDSANFLRLQLYNGDSTKTTEEIAGQGGQDPFFQATGGRQAGSIFDFIHQFTPKYTFTFHTEEKDTHPVWTGYNPYNLAQLITGAPGTTLADGKTVVPDTPGSGASPSLGDFLTPVNGVCPVASGCYVYDQLGQSVKLPISGINYNGAHFLSFAIAVRNQIQIREKLKLDLGARYDGDTYHYGPNQFNTNPADLNNPSDVNPATLANKYINPRTIDPRAAISYQFGPNDAVNAVYGRSTTFLNAQTSGTPAGLYNANALTKVPALDTVANPACGSGANPAGLFKCANYAQQLYWLYDQNFDAPDLGGAQEQIASNYSFTYQHQFNNGFAAKLTPFYKLSTGLPSFALLSETTNPVTGAILSEVFSANNNGINRTTGVEFGLTTPEKKYGLDGFFSATYQNVLTTAPPLITGEDSLPIITSGSLSLGNVYRAGYVSPFVARVGAEYKTRFGLRINPVLQYDIGYPFSVGDLIASRSPVDGAFANIPQVNVGPGRTTIPGFNGATGGALATNFVDPANPGSVFKPNVAATRGTPETAAAGGVLFHPELSANLTIEYKIGRSTYGVLANNLFGSDYYGIIPQVNPYYQPVSTGVAGPQTGKPKQVDPTFANGIYQNRGYSVVPTDSYAFKNGAYILPFGTPSTNPVRFQFYYQLAL